MSMQKHGMIGPDTPDLDAVKPLQKEAGDKPKKTPEELDQQDIFKREADQVRDRLKDKK